jgi:hypothetical protein
MRSTQPTEVWPVPLPRSLGRGRSPHSQPGRQRQDVAPGVVDFVQRAEVDGLDVVLVGGAEASVSDGVGKLCSRTQSTRSAIRLWTMWDLRRTWRRSFSHGSVDGTGHLWILLTDRHRSQDHQVSDPHASRERDHGTVGRQLPPGDPRPHPHRQCPAPTPGPRRIRNPFQHPPATPISCPRRAAATISAPTAADIKVIRRTDSAEPSTNTCRSHSAAEFGHPQARR